MSFGSLLDRSRSTELNDFVNSDAVPSVDDVVGVLFGRSIMTGTSYIER